MPLSSEVSKQPTTEALGRVSQRTEVTPEPSTATGRAGRQLCIASPAAEHGHGLRSTSLLLVC